MWVTIFDKLPNFNIFYCSKQLYDLRLDYSVYKYPILCNNPPMIYHNQAYHIFWGYNYLKTREILQIDWDVSRKYTLNRWSWRDSLILAKYGDFVFYKTYCKHMDGFNDVYYVNFSEILLIKCFKKLCFIYLKHKLIVISEEQYIFE